MTASENNHWAEQEDEPVLSISGKIDPQLHDAYWQSVYWSQPYYRADLDYEDYAPAFCVGYVGYAQYGRSFEEAERSLCANWLRLQGDSRLTLEEAMLAVRAAWMHAQQTRLAPKESVKEVVEEAVPELALA